MATKAARRTVPGKGPVQLHVGRLAVLALVLVAAALYVAPLRAFFAQQDRYHREAVALAQGRAENESLRERLTQMRDREYVTRRAREEFQLVPRGMQAFVIKGLPETDEVQRSQPVVAPDSPSLIDRLADLWRTLLQ